ncbi:MAG: hypothetical protein M0036_18780 [Desulfobacteraceae bacterium]|nr:hypothetical protein [Desulfobacteraceae bacterium]
MHIKLRLIIALLALLLLSAPASLWAAFGEDIEKPKPEFTPDNGDWIAKLVPRGKSSSIQIRFHMEGGTMTHLSHLEFAPGQFPKIDPKNFRSDQFMVQADTTPGGEVKLSVGSTYFTSATELWGPKAGTPLIWGTVGATNVGLPDQTNILTFTVRDGGPLDADGQVNGHITVHFGPRDSFWGYAIGTLLIRFFGVFIVLAVLEVGMIISGGVFQRLEARSKRSAPAPMAVEQTVEEEGTVTPQMAAAIALAIHLNSGAGRGGSTASSGQPEGSPWSQTGRAKLMADRMPVFDRRHHK